MNRIIYSQSKDKIYFDKGLEYAIKAEYSLARDAFEKISKTDQFYTQAKICLDICLKVINDELNKDVAYHYFNGINLAHNGNFEEAIKEKSRAITIDQNYFTLYLLRAACYNITGDYDLAIKDLNKAIDNLTSCDMLAITLAYRIEFFPQC